MPTHDATNTDAPGMRRPRYRRVLGTILLVALAWRLGIATLMPCLSRDAVTFCWYARDLGTRGVEFLRDPAAQQHPLFPTLLLGVKAGAGALGFTDTPLAWQRCGQLLALLSGMAVVVLAAALTARLVTVLKLPVDARVAGCLAAMLATLLPLNVQLSVDAMSDQLHLMWYLAGACLLLRMRGVASAALCGACAGLAFLTRPEGGAVLLAGAATLLAMRVSTSWRRLLPRAAALVVAFAVVAGPYFAVTGRISAKKNPLEWLRCDAPPIEFERAAALEIIGVPLLLSSAAVQQGKHCSRAVAHPTLSERQGTDYAPVAFAKLMRRDMPAIQLLPQSLYETLRAGRVVVPLLGLIGVLWLRRHLAHAAVVGLATCFALHLTLTLMLLSKYGYLNPRHTLVLIMLLMPFAAAALAGVHKRWQRSGRLHRWPWLVGVLVLPLAIYSLRVPNGLEGYLQRAGRWLARHDQRATSKLLVSGSGPRRVAFYADTAWQPWYEDAADVGALRGLLIAARADYFAIETSDDPHDFERGENAALLQALCGDPLIAPHIRQVYQDNHTPQRDVVHLRAGLAARGAIAARVARQRAASASSYPSSVLRAAASQVYSRAMRAASCGDAAMEMARPTADRIARGSPASQYSTSSPKYSRVLPPGVTTSAQPHNPASRLARPGVSYQLTHACTAAPAYKSRSSAGVRCPRNVTFAPAARRQRRSYAELKRPQAPTSRSGMSVSRSARIRASCPLRGSMRPTHNTPERSPTGGPAKANASTSTAFGTTTAGRTTSNCRAITSRSAALFGSNTDIVSNT